MTNLSKIIALKEKKDARKARKNMATTESVSELKKKLSKSIKKLDNVSAENLQKTIEAIEKIAKEIPSLDGISDKLSDIEKRVNEDDEIEVTLNIE